MLVKMLTFFALGAGLVTQLPPIPEMPIADTGMAVDTGGMDDTGDTTDTGTTEDTGDMLDTGDTTDTGGTTVTGDMNSDTDESMDTGDAGVTTGTKQSASEITGESGGCSAAGAATGPWRLGLLGLLARRRF